MSRRLALIHATVHTGEATLDDFAVVVAEGRVEAVLPSDAIPSGSEVRDLRGQHLAPGFIDLQVNGGGGLLFNDVPTVATLEVLASAHRRFGTTSLLPTFITGPREGMAAARAAVEIAIGAGAPGILGIHFEGPFLDPSKRGAHDAAFLRAPNDDDLAVIEAGTGGVTLLTAAACHLDAALVARLLAAGVVVSLGHSAATFEEACRAFESGVTAVTHLFNAMSPFESRAPGLVGAALDAKGVSAGLILDGVHVDFATARVAWHAVRPGGMFLVTDAVNPVGTDETEFRLAGQTVRVVDGRCVNEEGNLAGSVLDMQTAVQNAVRELGAPLDEALRMASTYPAELVGLGHERGRIAPGYHADLVQLDEDLEVVETFVAGVSSAEL